MLKIKLAYEFQNHYGFHSSRPWYISVNVSVLFILNTSDENSLFVYQAGWFMIFNFHGR